MHREGRGHRPQNEGWVGIREREADGDQQQTPGRQVPEYIQG